MITCPGFKKSAVLTAGLFFCCARGFAAAPPDGGFSVVFRLSKGFAVEDLAASLRGQFPGITVEAVVGDVFEAKIKSGRAGSGRELAEKIADSPMVAAAQLQEPSAPPELDAQADNSDGSWFISKIQAPLFWEKSKGSRSVSVLVCDTGIESGHPDLRGNIGAGMNFADGSGNTEPTGNGHGTRIAGLIGAQGGHTGAGASGVNWEVRIVPGKITNKPDGAVDHVVSAKCIKWGADQGIKVVNLSFSGAVNNLAVQEAAEYIYQRGGILVVSSGNKGEHPDYPDDPHMIVVGGTNSLDWRPPAYNTGKFVDLSAPASGLYTTDAGGKYVTTNGTSLSAAVVSGAAALILSVKPDLTAQQLIDLLLASTADLGAPGRDEIFGAGRLDLKKTLELLKL
ncbi:MAG: S8 family serine peptidase [Elusimicrobiales bacterium]